MKASAVTIAALALAACQTTPPEPIVRTVEVHIPVAVPCDTSDLGPRPAYPDTEERLESTDNIFAGVAILKAGRALRIRRELELEAALAACAGPVE